MSHEQRANAERWLAWVRLGAVPFVALQAVAADPYTVGQGVWLWATTAVFAAGAVVLLLLARRELDRNALRRLGLAALVFDFVVVSAFILGLYYQETTPIRQVMILVLVEAAFRYGIRGGLVIAAASVPVLFGFEWLRDHHFDQRFRWENVAVQVVIEVMIALIVGWLVERLTTETAVAHDREQEAEQLQDQLDRRSHVLDGANRCAQALGSSLELEEAFGAFIRELRGLVPFDRTAIMLLEEGHVRVMATAGLMHDIVLPPGEALPPGALVDEVLRTGETVYRRDMGDHRYPEEVPLTAIGLNSRVAAPLLLGTRPIGMVSILRRQADAFDEDELELAALLGRLLASSVQNIRAYESERATVAELRRLSALRADFVSLVSHELRSPMAAVIGAARTLEERWRELNADQRAAFLSLIARRDEPAGDADRRRAGHVADRGGHLLVPLHGSGHGGARPRHRRRLRAAPGRGQRGRASRTGTCRVSAATASGCARCCGTCSRTQSSTRRPARRSTSGPAPRTAASSSSSRTRARAYRPSSTG